MNIAIYSRKSKYSEKGESIDNQIQYCKDYAEIHLTHIPDKKYLIYEDEGFSAANTARPQFQKLQKDIKNHGLDILMCYRLDRINRNVSDFSKTLDLLEQYDVSFISATENFDTATPMGKAMIYIASVFAQLERETTAERVRDNMLALSHTGRWLGGQTPLGFKSEEILFLDKEYKERQLYKLVPAETELLTVKLLFQKYMELKSLSQVEYYLLTNHIKTQKNRDFTKSTISSILQNPTYCMADKKAYDYFKSLGCILANDARDFDGSYGILCYNRTKHQTGHKQKKRPPCEWVIALGRHKGIIHGEDFTYVQDLIKENKSKGNPRAETSAIALLSGKITCSSCGSKMRIKNVQKKAGIINFSYACEMKILSKGSRCHMTNISGVKLDLKIIETIRDLLSAGSPDNRYIPYLKQKEPLIKGTGQDRDKKLYSLHKEETVLNNAIQNLLSQVAQNDSPLTLKYLLPKLEELNKELVTVQREIDSIIQAGNEDNLQADAVQSLFAKLTDLNALTRDCGFQQKKYLINTIIEAIGWDGRNACITLKTNADNT